MSAQMRAAVAVAPDMTMEPGLTGIVIRPGDAEYDRARRVHNGRFDIRPAVIVYCRNTTDVVNAIAWSARQNVPLRVRSGGHSYEGYSTVEDGIIVDTSCMKRIEVDPDRRVADVQAGATLLPLYETLWRYGLTVPSGSYSTVGIAGATLGGGFGLLARRHGLTCDNLREVEIVTADGRIRTASHREEYDLFWACRGGGGGNFGIVTRFTFALHPVSDVAVYFMSWEKSELERVMDLWQMWAPGADERLTCILKLTARSTDTIISIGQFDGPEWELRELLHPLMELRPASLSIETLPYIEAVRRFAGLRPDYRRWAVHRRDAGTKFRSSSAYAYRPIELEGITTIARRLARAPNAWSVIQLDNYGGAISRVANDSTAFAHRRGVLFNLQLHTSWSEDEEEGENTEWIERSREEIRPYVSGRADINYCDRTIPDWPNAYYGNNIDRLMEVKSEYDPTNFFSFPQSIPLAPTFARY